MNTGLIMPTQRVRERGREDTRFSRRSDSRQPQSVNNPPYNNPPHPGDQILTLNSSLGQRRTKSRVPDGFNGGVNRDEGEPCSSPLMLHLAKKKETWKMIGRTFSLSHLAQANQFSLLPVDSGWCERPHWLHVVCHDASQ